MAEYWLVSAPGEKTPQQTFEALKSQMVGLSPVWKFSIPELKVRCVIHYLKTDGDSGTLKALNVIFHGFLDAFLVISDNV